MEAPTVNVPQPGETLRVVRWLGDVEEGADPLTDPRCMEIVEIDNAGNRRVILRRD